MTTGLTHLPHETKFGLRVLLATDFYLPFIGGSERQVQLLAKQLAASEHQVVVATVKQPGLLDCQDVDGIDVYRLGAWTTRVPWFSSGQRRYHPPFADPGVVLDLRRLIGSFQPDVVHASGWIAYSCALALRNSATPLVVSARDYGYSCATRTMLHNGRLCDGPNPVKCLICATRTYRAPKALAAVSGVLLGRLLLGRRVTAVHSISGFVEAIVRRDLFSKQHGCCNTNVVIPDFLEQSSSAASRDDGPDALPREPFILFVGALRSHKGLDVLLAAYQRVRDAPPLVLIGTLWPDSPKSYPPGVMVLTDVSHERVMRAWERCLFGVAPSIWAEPLGDVVMEGMSKGKAIVGSAIGGHAELIVQNETGLLVSPADVQALASAIALLSTDAVTRDRLGQAAQTRAAQLTAEAIFPRFEALYATVASGH